MGVFSLLNWEDYILNTVVKSSYAKNGLTVLLLYLLTAVLRLHLSIIISFLFVFNNFLDLILPILISVLISMCSDTLFKYVETHRSICESIVEYGINNYSRENFVIWKRILLGVLFLYILIAISMITIDNYFILVSTVQTFCSFIICDCLENKIIQRLYKKLPSLRRKKQKMFRVVSSSALNKPPTPSRQVEPVKDFCVTPPKIRRQSLTPSKIRRQSLTPPKIRRQASTPPK